MWKFCGIKIEGTRARYFFLGTDKEISEKRNFLVYRSVMDNFQREFFSGQVPTESLRTQDSEKFQTTKCVIGLLALSCSQAFAKKSRT